MIWKELGASKLVAHGLPYTVTKDGQAVASAYSVLWSSGSGTQTGATVAIYKNSIAVNSRSTGNSYAVSGSNIAYNAGCTALMNVVKGDVISAGSSPGGLAEAIVWCTE